MLGIKAILLIALIGTVSLTTFASAESDGKIPTWVKTIAGLWASNAISDDEYLEIMQYLVDNGMLRIPQEITNTSYEPSVQITPQVSANPFSNSPSKYTPELEVFEKDGKYINALITLKSRDGSFAAKDGKLNMYVMNSAGQVVYSDRKYIYKTSFDDYSVLKSNADRGVEWVMHASQFKGTATHSGTVHLTFHDTGSGKRYSNVIPYENMPFDHIIEQQTSSFPNSLLVNENLNVGPFTVSVNEVGNFYELSSGQVFRVDLDVQNNRGTPVKFVIDDMMVMDPNLKLYSAYPESMESLEELILPNGIREGTVLFEKVPPYMSKIKLFLSIDVLEDVNMTDSHKFNDIVEISLR